jgi:hypothetical protein
MLISKKLKLYNNLNIWGYKFQTALQNPILLLKPDWLQQRGYLMLYKLIAVY